MSQTRRNRARLPIYAARERPSLGEQILVAALRALPFVARSILVVTIATGVVLAGAAAWSALSPRGAATSSTSRRSEDVHASAPSGLLNRIETYAPAPGGGEQLVHSRSFTYERATGRLASVTSPQGMTSYKYTPSGDIARVRTSRGDDMRFVRDALGRLILARCERSTAAHNAAWIRYAYDSAGRLTRLERSNGVATDCSYDPSTGWLSSIEDKVAGSEATLLRIALTRDLAGFVVGVEETRDGDGAGPEPASVVAWTHAYDRAKRLVRSTREETGGDTVVYSLAYDGACNLTRQTIQTAAETRIVDYAYNSLGQLVQDGSGSYEYDTFGHLAKETKNDGTYRVYSWDSEDHLVKVEFRDAQGGLVKTVEFAYDDLGALISKKIDNEPPTYFLVDHRSASGLPRVLCEYSIADPDAGISYLCGDGPGPLARISASGGAEFFHADHLGSTRLLTGADGTAIAPLDYSPYGEPADADGLPPTDGELASILALADASPGRGVYAFTGQRRDADLGRQRHGARWYNPATANWLSQDPSFDFPNNFGNTYLYAGANPTSLIDLSGTMTFAEVLSAVGIVANIAGTAYCGYNFYKEPTWSNGAWVLVSGLGFVPAKMIMQWAARGLKVGSDALRVTSAAKLAARTAGLPALKAGQLFEQFVQARLAAGKIPGLGRVVTVSTSWMRGSAPVGNDLMAVGPGGIPKIFEVSLTATRNFAKNDILEYKGIAKRLLSLVRRGEGCVDDLLEMGIDKRFLNRTVLEDIVERGAAIPDWFQKMERYAITPAVPGKTAWVPEGVTLIQVP
ncbi:RHS repeat-associated core domain-containing protein [Candidatus Sumerlaeota bacterium]|nr:RHS repeat-associated core domain-containing protein [Candidatus Sumerlaeota bacterium]